MRSSFNHKPLVRQSLLALTLLTLFLVTYSPAQAASSFYRLFSPSSPFNIAIPATATYTRETRIGSFRHNYQAYSMPIYRLAAGDTVPLVTVTNTYSGRRETWPIPTYALPSTGDDHHLAVLHEGTGYIYELWDASWQSSTSIRAGGMVAFPIQGTGISDPPHYRVTASGFAVSAGMVIRENFTNPTTGQLSLDQPLNHALTMSLPFDLVDPDGFVAPAIHAEEMGRDPNGVPMGALFALPRNLNVDSLNVSPFTRELLRAARDYGIYVNDTNGASRYQNQFAGTIRVEDNLIQDLTGISNDNYLDDVQSEVYQVIQQYGIYRVEFDYTAVTPTPPAPTTPAPTTPAPTTPAPTTPAPTTPAPTTPAPTTPPPTTPAPTTPAPTPAAGAADLFGSASPFNVPLSAAAAYSRDDRIGSFRQNYEAWSMPIYRVPPGQTPSLVTVVNTASGRTESWPIPTSALPAPSDDAHLGVLLPGSNVIYEFRTAQWAGPSQINAAAMHAFPLTGTGVSDPPAFRVTAAGFAVSAGMVILDDFVDPQTGQLNPAQPINHALAMSLHFDLVAPDAFVAPAVGGESLGRATQNGIPMGARFALPPDLNVDSLNVHPLTRELLRAARDYGLYLNDANASSPMNGRYVGALRIEPGLTQALYGTANDALITTVQNQIYAVIQQHGIYRVDDLGAPASLPPAAASDSYTTPHNQPLAVAAPGVLGNDHDPENAPLTALLDSPPLHGALTLHSSGAFSYTPNPGFSGPDSFTYRASDGLLQSPPALVSLTVSAPPANQPPLLAPIGNKTVAVGQTLSFNVSASDAEGDPLTYSVGNLPAGATFNPLTRAFVWMPAASQVNPYGVTFRVSDGPGSDEETITINVVPAGSPGEVLFADSFESGTLAAWSGATTRGGDLRVTPAAALAGSYGLEASLDDNGARYVRDDRPQAETAYSASFLMSTSRLRMASGDVFDFFVARNSSTAMLKLQLRFRNGQYQVRAQTRRDGSGWENTAWSSTSASVHTFALAWQAATAAGADDGLLTLLVDGAVRQTISGLNNDTFTIEQVRLGTVSGLDSGTRGALSFDDFVSYAHTAQHQAGSALQLAASANPPVPLTGSFLQNGDFAAGMSAWLPLAGAAQTPDGTLHLAPTTTVQQDTGFAAAATLPLELTLALGNNGTAPTTVTVSLLDANTPAAGPITCHFTVPASTPLQGGYVVRGSLPQAWANIRVEVRTDPGSADTLADNLTLAVGSSAPNQCGTISN